jgi:uridine phosphorylase
VFNHIITVGDPRRAIAISELMDGYGDVNQTVIRRSSYDSTEDGQASKALEKKYPHVMIRQSHRGFLTISGKYKGLPVSVIAIGMG